MLTQKPMVPARHAGKLDNRDDSDKATQATRQQIRHDEAGSGGATRHSNTSNPKQSDS